MVIIYRYLIIEFAKPLFFSVVSFGGLVMISEFFRELNFFLEKKAAFSDVFAYLFLNFPWWCIQVLPVSVLLAVLFSMGQMARQNEITALKAAGINLWRIVSVLLLCGLIIGMAELALRETAIPRLVQKSDIVRREKIQKEPRTIQTEYHDLVIALPPDGRMTVGRLDASNNAVSGLVLDYFSDGYRLSRQLVARDGTWDGGYWILRSGVERSYQGNKWNEKRFDSLKIQLAFKPEDFVITNIRPEQMTAGEYLIYIHRMETLGMPAEKELIRFHSRWAAVFSHIVVMLIGIPFAVGLGARHGKMISFSFALIIAFIYWGFQAVGQSLGETRFITPLAAAWIGNIIFGSVGIFLTGRIKK
ncbi:MAG: hypothetical protein A2219_02435 [Elusimicrobia bacterium RIFOXYA2_FULL_50_26]|nr:MAG: hypothetical protein A2219_02435 [Elusimicrobia bacterium RIFOXYA2_FULL_50_26]OGS24067.1 MAG: hypothetical protein A2314_01500 [Elusimicrobia bacterium RIFOXYB2_FULL_50_12]